MQAAVMCMLRIDRRDLPRLELLRKKLSVLFGHCYRIRLRLFLNPLEGMLTILMGMHLSIPLWKNEIMRHPQFILCVC